MKKNIVDFVAGFLLGIIYFFGSAMFDVEWLGTGLFIEIFRQSDSALFLFGVWFVFLGIIPFILYYLSPLHKKYHPERSPKYFFLSFFFFSIGVYLSFFIFLLVAGIAFSLTTGPF